MQQDLNAQITVFNPLDHMALVILIKGRHWLQDIPFRDSLGAEDRNNAAFLIHAASTSLHPRI